MTRLRQIAMAGLAATAIGGVASSASAVETGNFENRLYGATIGLPLAAAPPPGLYSGYQAAFLGDLNSPGNGGHSKGTWCIPSGNGTCASLPATTAAVPILWVPGWNFWGATYSASVVQAFYEFHTCGGTVSGTTIASTTPGAAAAGIPATLAGNGTGNCTGAFPFTSGGFVYTNTFIQPIDLSWKLGDSGWFIGAAFSFLPPDGTRLAGTPNPDYWTFEPSLYFSYLGNNWVLSANFFYDINTRDQGVFAQQNNTITNGNILIGDFTALYKFGKWTVGPVGAFEAQTTNDTGVGCSPAPGVLVCGKRSNIQVGGLLGYDWGPVNTQVWVTDVVEGVNTPQSEGGINVNFRLGFKLWGPEAPVARPLVSKQ